MAIQEQLITDLSEKLLSSQKMLIELRQLAIAAQEPKSVDTIDDLLALGLQMGAYVTTLSTKLSTDDKGLVEVKEYCDLVSQIYTKTEQE
jgi:hypothetical protein